MKEPKEIQDKRRSIFKFRRKKDKEKEYPERSFTAYVIRGNRQVIKREVNASKRFVISGDTYLIKPKCIFLKRQGDKLESASYYREGNPNPYNFVKPNVGIDAIELERIFSEDFFHIVTNLKIENRMIYLAGIMIINVTLAAMTLVWVFIGSF